MKGLAHPSFFRVVDLLVASSNPGLKLSSWAYHGVACERERHSFSGPSHGLSIEIITLTRTGRSGWSVMVVKEYWWSGTDGRALKALRWAKLLNGQRAELLGWLRAQEASKSAGPAATAPSK